jgi:hypothetical protein
MGDQLNSASFHRLSLTGRANKAMSFTVKIWTLLSVHILLNPFWHLEEQEKEKLRKITSGSQGNEVYS